MKKHTIFLIFILFSLFIAGCKYDFIMPVEVPPITGTVSFSTQVAPIFSAGTKCTSCHNTGGESPILSAASAYASIVPGLINSAAPETSKIYSIPGSSSHAWKGYTAGEAAIILAWIKDGAKNN